MKKVLSRENWRNWQQLQKAVAKNVTIDGINFNSKDFKLNTDPTVEYKEIGIGKPLSAEIMCIYTGDYIHGWLPPKKRDVLCVSGVKSTATFDAASRAMNLLQDGVKENQYLSFSAMQNGTPYIYYTKAVDSDSLMLSIELNSDSFNDNLFSAVSDLLAKAAGLPIFMLSCRLFISRITINKGRSGRGQCFV